MCLMALTIRTTISCSDKEDGIGGGSETLGTYVDLGLSSGTKWKTLNEKNDADAEYDFFTYDEAVSRFGNRLPTIEQWKELKSECQWSWTGSGYKVTAPNGNSISLPAAGCRDFYGRVYGRGSSGGYWSSTPNGSDGAWYLRFHSGSVNDGNDSRGYGRSVRLVQD